MEFKSVEAFEEFILDKCEVAVAQVEQKVHTAIDDCLKQFYGEFTPSEYIRTNKLMHSLVKTGVKRVGNGVEAEVYFDAGALNYASPVRGQSGRMHDAIYSGGEVLEMAMHGSHGGYVDGTPIWETANSRLGNIIALLVQALKANGVPIK